MNKAARLSAFGIVVLAVIAVSVGLWYGQRVGLIGGQVAHEIRADLKARAMPDDAPWRDRRTQALLRGFYANRKMNPAWTTGARPNSQARDLAEILQHADREGLNPADYATAPLLARLEQHKQASLDAMDAKALADFDLLCSIAALHYMSDVFDGRIAPHALDAVWVAHPRPGDLNEILQAALQQNRIRDAFAALPPTHDGYVRLRSARAKYAAIVEQGGWAAIAPGPALRKGQHGVRVLALRARLAASGDLSAGAATGGDRFDDAVEAAVKQFQERYGRDADGVVGASELAMLNVPAATRLRQIELNMERWRWLPKTFGDRHLVVNIPEYMLHYYEGGKPVLDMRVVVGKAMNQTPVFSDTMTVVVVNPTWNVPASIVANEIGPAIAEDKNYLAKHHMRLLDGTGDKAKDIDPSDVDWGDSTSLRKIAVRQDAGEDNALGKLKFLFPNSFDIYLHDTPAGALFSREDRSFSHGCVRVEDPVRLATYVLEGGADADTARLRTLINAGATKYLKIPNPLPVNIVYFTAFGSDDGAVGFREDVYGIDADLVDQLRGRARAQVRSQATGKPKAGSALAGAASHP
ncbi:MAG: L,D-transpeptidase family protein [Candidatus Eisenbacteria bacterium]